LQPGISGTGRHVTRSGTSVLRPDTLKEGDPVGNLRSPLFGLAVGCLHIMLDRAVVNFPTSCVASPSKVVVVELAYDGPIRESYRPYFPFNQRWDYWQQVVAPMLKDPRNQPAHNPNIATMINLKRYDDVALIYQRELEMRFQENGWLPSDDQQELIETEVPDPPAVPTAEPVDAVPLPRLLKVGASPILEDD